MRVNHGYWVLVASSAALALGCDKRPAPKAERASPPPVAASTATLPAPSPLATTESLPDGAPMAAAESIGHLPQDQIQRVVRERFDVFRECYEAGLARNPNLEGRVSIRFVIDREGRVQLAEPTADTNLPAPSVVACVLKGYRSLTFPKPVGGIVTVVYPIIFNPGDD